MPLCSINIIWSHVSPCWNQSLLHSCTYEQRRELCRTFVWGMFYWQNLQPKNCSKCFSRWFWSKNREQEEPGKVMAIRAFCNWTPNIWHKTTDKMSCYWKEKSFLNIWVSTGSVIMPFLLLYMNCYRNSLVQEWSWRASTTRVLVSMCCRKLLF